MAATTTQADRGLEEARPAASALVLTPRQQLAVFARALYREGYDDHNTGHITYRDSGSTFWTLPMDRGWDEVCASEIIRIDLEGRTVEGASRVTPSIQLHLQFHLARSGVNVTVHQHPRYATAWSAVGRIPPTYDQFSALLAQDEITLYNDYEGGVGGVEAARSAVRAIGSSGAALLRNHGVFVVGDSIEQAFTRCLSLEWRSRQAWLVGSLGGGNTMPEIGVEQSAEYMRKHGERPGLWAWAVRREIRLDPGVIE